jgi:hypothetical protein
MSAPEKKTPTEWAKETVAPDGKPNFIPCRHRWQRAHFGWQHQAAAVRHGWKDHELATSAEIELTREDYLAALDAVSQPKARAAGMHLPAVSVWCTATDKVAKRAGIAKRNETYRAALNKALEEHAAKHAAWLERYEMCETEEEEEPAFIPPEPPLLASTPATEGAPV